MCRWRTCCNTSARRVSPWQCDLHWATELLSGNRCEYHLGADPGLAAESAANAIAGAKLIEYEGEPHGLFATVPERLNRDLLEFLR